MYSIPLFSQKQTVPITEPKGACLNLSRLEKLKDRPGRIEARCPACAKIGSDKTGNHLIVYPDGRFGCAANPGDREHRRRIFELVGVKSGQPFRPSPMPRREPIVSPSPILPAIASKFRSCVADFWELSPIRCDEDLYEAQVFLSLFPASAIVCISDDVRHSGLPEHAAHFRPRSEWQRQRLTRAGLRVCPCTFQPGSYSRSIANVDRHLYAVIESDSIPKDQFCSIVRWLMEACEWRLAAMVDSGGRSLHAWFHHPGDDIDDLKPYSGSLGLDNAYARPSQPWRLPGVARENSDRRQQLVYLNLEGAV